MIGDVSELSYGYVESGIIFNTLTLEDFRKHISVKPDDFAVHQDAYEFLVDFLDTYKKAPTPETLKSKFEDLSPDSIGENLEFCLETFKNHCLIRKTLKCITDSTKNIRENPKESISKLLSGLDGLHLSYDDDIYIYNDGSLDRLDAFKERQRLRNDSKLNIIGIPTPIRSINNLGLGVLPGEICSLIARPGVGKSWFALKAAAIAVSLGYRTLFLTTEMPAEQMSLRFDVMLGRIKGYKFSHSALKLGKDSFDINAYEKFLRENNKKNMIMLDHTQETITSLIRKYKPDVFIVDNMELMMAGTNNYTRMWERMYELYYGLKNVCTSNKIASFVTHQATRDAVDPFKPPSRNEISSGDALLRASDMVLSMCLIKDDDKQRLISFQKFRDTEEEKDHVIMEFDVDVGVFSEI